MKKMLIGMMLLIVLVGGCTNLPTGVKTSLYTAQITMYQTVKEANAATTEPWVIPTDATMEQKLAKREAQVSLLIRTMDQAEKNLATVTDYFRTGKENPGE